MASTALGESNAKRGVPSGALVTSSPPLADTHPWVHHVLVGMAMARRDPSAGVRARARFRKSSNVIGPSGRDTPACLRWSSL